MNSANRKGVKMGKRYRPEEIVMKLRGIELSMNMGRLEFLSKVIITKVNITLETVEKAHF